MESFDQMKVPALRELAKARGLKSAYKYKKSDLLQWLRERQEAPEKEEPLSKNTKKKNREDEPPKGSHPFRASSKSSKSFRKASGRKAGARKDRKQDGEEGRKRSNHKTGQNHRKKTPAGSLDEEVKASIPDRTRQTLREISAKEGEKTEVAKPNPSPRKGRDEELGLSQGEEPHGDLPSASGVLEVMAEGYGFLRSETEEGENKDYYVPQSHIKRFSLRSGDIVEGIVGDNHDKDKYAPIIYIQSVNGTAPFSFKDREDFDELTPIYANERIRLEQGKEDISNRIVDLVAPIGKGQRGLIVSPPKAGKTSLLKSIAQAVEAKYPSIYLFILLIDERPEEVTDFEWSVNHLRKAEDPIRTEVISSTFDKPAVNHTQTAEKLIDRAKRLVESGQDVMILLDSLTRLSRAYNITTQSSGRTLSGGLDPVALYPPKSFFGAARNIHGDGSLTILATCLKDTGSRMDDMIYEEFKGTGNMEVHLSRDLSEMRVFPAIDIFASGTRREDLLLTKEEQETMNLLRKRGHEQSHDELMMQFVQMIKNTDNNKEFCSFMNRSLGGKR